MTDDATPTWLRPQRLSDWLGRAIPPRPCRGDAPIEYSDNPVPVRGDPLHRILWRGRQWAVTEYGIECLDGTYPIERDRLGTEPWPMHVTGKMWVDSDDFTTAWLVALSLHGVTVEGAKVRDAVSRAYPAKDRPAVYGGRWREPAQATQGRKF